MPPRGVVCGYLQHACLFICCISLLHVCVLWSCWSRLSPRDCADDVVMRGSSGTNSRMYVWLMLDARSFELSAKCKCSACVEPYLWLWYFETIQIVTSMVTIHNLHLHLCVVHTLFDRGMRLPSPVCYINVLDDWFTGNRLQPVSVLHARS